MLTTKAPEPDRERDPTSDKGAKAEPARQPSDNHSNAPKKMNGIKEVTLSLSFLFCLIL